MKTIYLTLTLSSGLILSACGGSSSANNVRPVAPAPTPAVAPAPVAPAPVAPVAPAPTPAVLPATFTTQDAALFATAAKATPRQGSVIQSSSLVTTIEMVADKITVGGIESANIEIDRNGGSESVTFSENGIEGTVKFYLEKTNDGNLGVIAGETNYLQFGLWAYEPDEGISTSALELGVFTTADNDLTSEQVTALTGMATFVGAASALYIDSVGGVVEVVEAAGEITLNADFDANTISGTIVDIEVDEVIVATEVMLGEATINSATNGFWTGSTSVAATADNPAMSGNWGGQLYGESGSADYAAGTFGGASSDDSAAFLGTFVARERP